MTIRHVFALAVAVVALLLAPALYAGMTTVSTDTNLSVIVGAIHSPPAGDVLLQVAQLEGRPTHNLLISDSDHVVTVGAPISGANDLLYAFEREGPSPWGRVYVKQTASLRPEENREATLTRAARDWIQGHTANYDAA